MAKDSDIIPFGKYKNQPVQIVAETDPQYLEWISQQAWIQSKYPNLYQIIINNAAEPSETPEHNRLQARFLDDEFCKACAEVVFSELMRNEEFEKPLMGNIKEISSSFEPKGFDVSFTGRYLNTRPREVRRDFVADAETELRNVYVDGWGYYEVITVRAGKKYHFYESVDIEDIDKFNNIFVEIKTSLGDDYPAVLRQIKSGMQLNSEKNGKGQIISPFCGIAVLFIDQFAAQGATLQQVRQIFSKSNIHLITLAEVEGVLNRGN